MKIIAVANQKGGVGKTTTAVNLAAGLAMAGRRTLLVDVDPQCNATSSLDQVLTSEPGFDSYHIFVNPQCVDGALATTKNDHLFVVKGNHELVKLDQMLVNSETAYSRLEDALGRIKMDFDFVIIDCPPSLSLIPLSCFTAAHSLLIPIQAEYYPLEGLSQIVEILDMVKIIKGKEVDIEGVLITMFDANEGLAHEVLGEAEKSFGDKVFKAVIPRDGALAESPSFGVPIFEYAPSSLGAISYALLAKEIVSRSIV